MDDGAENILIVKNERDPVTLQVGGHSAFIFGHSADADYVTTTHLVTGKMPAKDLTC